MAGTTLEHAINKLFENYKNAITIAAKDAANKATKDIFNHALTCLEAYYLSYSPSIYDRTDMLQNAFLPYQEVIDNNTSINVIAGVEYDSSRIQGFYNGSKKYRPVDGSWVLDNYLRGVHPITNGGRTTDSSIYYEVVDPVSPTQMMEEYLKAYIKDDFQQNLMYSLARQALAINS
jgi:hypothetical protein